MKKKLLSTLLCAAMAVSMLAGCGGSDSNVAADNSTASDATETTASADNQASGEDVTIEFWTIDLKAAFGDFFNDMIAQYESENPGVTVNWRRSLWRYPVQTCHIRSRRSSAGRCELKHTVYFNISRTGSIS